MVRVGVDEKERTVFEEATEISNSISPEIFIARVITSVLLHK